MVEARGKESQHPEDLTEAQERLEALNQFLGLRLDP